MATSKKYFISKYLLSECFPQLTISFKRSRTIFVYNYIFTALPNMSDSYKIPNKHLLNR